METVLKAIADWIKGILTAGIMSNLSGLFDDVNTQVGHNACRQDAFDPVGNGLENGFHSAVTVLS